MINECDQLLGTIRVFVKDEREWFRLIECLAELWHEWL